MNASRLALTLLTVTIFAITGCVSNSSVATAPEHPPIAPEQVTLYFQEPAEFEVLGHISASSGDRWDEERSVEYALKELKKQAASLGANGLLLDLEVDTTTTIDNSYKRTTAKTVKGTAIFVKGR